MEEISIPKFDCKSKSKNVSNKVFPNRVISSISSNLLHEFQILWTDFSVKVEQNSYLKYLGKRPTTKYILQNLSGGFKSGELSAIMGPSGCGKSTLLNCISGRWREGKIGEIFISGQRLRVNLAFIPQHDNYFEVLTVEETMMFASRLQTSTLVASNYYDAIKMICQDQPERLNMRRYTISDANYHRLNTLQILRLFGLENVLDVRVGKLSGGQKKRLSIAQELISKPDILVLDEPTSGLDSTASLHCIEILHLLAQSKPSMAIIITIHQPNMRIFELLRRVYILSHNGKCIYNGPSEGIVGHLEKNGYPCPTFQNPGEFLLEIASAEHGEEAINKFLETPYPDHTYDSNYNMKKALNLATVRVKYPHLQHFVILMHRSFVLIMRDPILAMVRFSLHIGMALFLGWIYGPHIGIYAGCPPDFGENFDLHAIRNSSEKVVIETKGILDNFSALFFNLMMLMFSSLTPVLVSFPMDVSIFLKEKWNGWYATGPYFLAKTLSDLPFQLLATFLYVTITYVMNGQIKELWRYEYYLLYAILISLIGQSHGLVVGALFVHQITTAVFFGPLSTLPLLLFSGFLVKIETMPYILKPLTCLSYIRYGFEGALISLYGFHRCGEHTGEKLSRMKAMLNNWLQKMLTIATQAIQGEELENDPTAQKEIEDVKKIADSLSISVINSFTQGITPSNNSVQSAVMVIYSLEDYFMYRAIVVLLINLVVYRVATYLIIKMKARN